MTVDNVFLVVTTEAKHAAVENSGTLRDVVLAAMKPCRDHWLEPNDNRCLHAAIVGAMAALGELGRTEERRALQAEYDILCKLASGTIEDVIELSAQVPEPLGLLAMWEEEK